MNLNELNELIGEIPEEEEEVRCVCDKCFGEGMCYVSKERARELERLELMESECPYGDKCEGEEEEEQERELCEILQLEWEDLTDEEIDRINKYQNEVFYENREEEIKKNERRCSNMNCNNKRIPYKMLCKDCIGLD